MTIRKSPAYLIAFLGVMAAAAFVSNFMSIDVGTSRIHAGNSVPLLSGMLFGGPLGALASGLGSALYDIVTGYSDKASGYSIPYFIEAIVTFINKGLMALVCGLIVNDRRNRIPRDLNVYLGAVAGALLYLALYLLKTNLYSLAFTPNQLTFWVSTRAVTSSINAAIAVLLAPFLYAALRPALEKSGLYRTIDPRLLDWPGK